MQNTVSARIYGDSIMKGTIIDERMRYRATMAEAIENFQNQFHMAIENNARFGSTVDKGEERLLRDLEKGISCHYALIEFGGNDCDFHWAQISGEPHREHLPLTPLDRFIEIYRAMIARLMEKGIRPVLMTLPPIDSERYFEFVSRGLEKKNILSWLGDIHAIYRFHEMYSNAIVKIAREAKAPLIDVRERFLGIRQSKNFIGLDGIHLNPEGYRIMIDAITDFTARYLPRGSIGAALA